MTKKVDKSKKPSPNKKTIPWDDIRAAYVADETLTFSVLATKFGISKSSVGKKAKAEDWKSLRKVSTNTTIEEVQKQKAENIADANKRHLEGAKMIQEATLSGIKAIKDNEIEEIIWFREEGENSEDVKKRGELKEAGRRYINGPVYNAKTLNELIRGYRLAADLERAVLGLATGVTKFGDEDGNEQPPVVYDIMGGRKVNAASNDDDKPGDEAGTTSSKS